MLGRSVFHVQAADVHRSSIACLCRDAMSNGALQDGVTGSRQWQAAAVHLLGLLLGGAERSESLAGCASPFARHATHTATPATPSRISCCVLH